MEERKLAGKIIFQGTLQCLTGLHIGASKENMEIGALDSPVVRDPVTRQPYIPGASMKGKLRTLLEKANPHCLPNRNGGTSAKPVMRHECNDLSQARACPVCRLFGSTAVRGKNSSGQENRNHPSLLKVRDLYLTPASLAMLEKIDTGLLYTEWKFENALDRITSAANPRNLERVPKGAEFTAALVYDVEDLDLAKEDLQNLQLALRLLEDDALGGHGSRGYGQVRVQLESVIGRKVADYKNPTTADFGQKVSDLSQLDDLWSYFSA